MAECYYSYSFDLKDGLIMEEVLDANLYSPMKAVGLEAPLEFDDFVDVWKDMCRPVFEKDGDEEKLTWNYFKTAYERGETSIIIELEHNPLKNTYAAKYTRVNIKLFEDAETKNARATVMWEDNPELEKEKCCRPSDSHN